MSDLFRGCLMSGGVLGGVAVAAGAFGAHGLKGILEAAGQTGNWETASRYALAHAVVLVAVGAVAATPESSPARGLLAAAAWSFLLGSLVFSGCLATLALTGVKMLGAIVPVGGGLLIVGWACLAIAAFRIGR